MLKASRSSTFIMRQSVALLFILVGSACAESVLTYFLPGVGEGDESFILDPVASIKTSSPSTTVFALGCPSSVPSHTTCDWSSYAIDYTIISSTHYEIHVTEDVGQVSAGYMCDYSSLKMTCTVSQSGGNDALMEPLTVVLPDEENGLQLTFATATVVEEGVFSSGGVSASTRAAASTTAASTGLKTASGSAPSPTSLHSGSGVSATGANTAIASGSASVAVSTGAAANFGLEGSAIVALAGAAALNFW
ncbi:hypothetical protein P153DRAFT_394618 [Dothidotthia symphoricarpi CBS 119687]|uniref:GPI anchored protein n=1 Tax=Dothidotthia symphoricarpi CBS 119687 TaxID=1392245 RepID=A0A6A6ALD2_9PLEO|nr:uncharacterized protein P153DRAFT_394618 [Dothidotthia symphoricarpi CBS 119687]KAF2131261.1 hypothetical protein P153DRAFT_394618 [Dothidotthia symphoricarpi CBS 119687]